MPATRVQKAVQAQIQRTLREIEKRRRDIQGLQRELARMKKAARLLGAADRGAPRGRRRKQVDWDKAFGRVPRMFTMNELAATPEGRARSRAYLHQVVLRWKKKKLLSSAGKGKYQKA